ncbi:transcriptional repressor [Azospirillum thermophilum]|uniref:Fur family transcriptional regulator n=1 Tax=Azospirillum thermophilum TaxID=2202148 RepID=UPI0026AEA331
MLIDPRISIATVYRTMRLLEDAQVIERVDLGDGRAATRRRPPTTTHLIDTRTGRIIEFSSPELEMLKERIARELGYRIVDHRLEIYGVPLDDATASVPPPDGGEGRGHPFMRGATRRRRSACPEAQAKPSSATGCPAPSVIEHAATERFEGFGPSV